MFNGVNAVHFIIINFPSGLLLSEILIFLNQGICTQNGFTYVYMENECLSCVRWGNVQFCCCQNKSMRPEFFSQLNFFCIKESSFSLIDIPMT